MRKVQIDIQLRRQKKALAIASAFFNEINPLTWICEMRFAREIRLRRVKCLRACVDLFHFTLLPMSNISHFS